MLKRTPFHDFHVAAGAKLVEFAGWEMPILYRGIVEEHEQTRNSGSLFDVSHMGRLYFSGRDAQRFLDHVVTRNVAQQKVGQSRYSLVCNELGGVLDDVIVSRDERHWLVVCNASNREKLVRHFESARQDRGGFDIKLDDRTESTAMVAVQGPKVIDKLSEVLPTDLRALKRYSFANDEVMLTRYTVFRSGYTGEDGIEMILPAKAAGMAMKMLDARSDHPGATIRPAGLGARDTLRLEAGMPLYGHELGESIDPLTAGLAWAVDLGGKEFIGAEALRERMGKGLKRRLVGLELEGRRIARQGTPVTQNGKVVGEVTSGTFSPTLQKSIAMAFVDSSIGEGADVAADLKRTLNPAKVVKLPFYKRTA
jgi:glycine cleavage system T protein (aminomethyltransferase)